MRTHDHTPSIIFIGRKFARGRLGVRVSGKRGLLLPAIWSTWIVLNWTGTSRADSYTYSLTNGTQAAAVEFVLSGPTTLSVTLSNTSSADTLVPTDVLTAVYFNVTGSPTFGETSAILATGSTVIYDPDGQPAGGVVGGEWAYVRGIGVTVGSGLGATTYNEGISSSGLGIFGPADRFPGPNLAGPADPAGVQYGLLTAGDKSATGNGGITGSGGLIKNSVVFTLQVASSFTLSQLGNKVAFQYGTDLSEPSFNSGPPTISLLSVPEPSSILIAALSGLGLVGYGRLRVRAS
jgi:hypothetical protein